MGRSFSTQRGTVRIVFGAGSSKRITAELDATPSAPRPCARRWDSGAERHGVLDRGRPRISVRWVLAIARDRVPTEIVAEARAALTKAEADVLLAIGGGSAIGLAKAAIVARRRKR